MRSVGKPESQRAREGTPPAAGEEPLEKPVRVLLERDAELEQLLESQSAGSAQSWALAPARLSAKNSSWSRVSGTDAPSVPKAGKSEQLAERRRLVEATSAASAEVEASRDLALAKEMRRDLRPFLELALACVATSAAAESELAASRSASMSPSGINWWRRFSICWTRASTLVRYARVSGERTVRGEYTHSHPCAMHLEHFGYSLEHLSFLFRHESHACSILGLPFERGGDLSLAR